MARTRFHPGRSTIGPSNATNTLGDPIQEDIPSNNHSLRQSGGHIQENPFDLGIDDDNQFSSDDDQPEENMDSSKKSRNGRGPTRMHKIWARRDGEQLALTFNEFDQPIGDDAAKFTNFLGTIARSGNDAPLIYRDWRHMPLDNKKIMWNTVKLKYNLGDDNWPWVMKALGKKWKDFKSGLKKKHYDAHNTYEDRLADRDSRVLPEQWKQLIEYWDTEEGQTRSLRSKSNRSKQITTHTAGSRSFARIHEEKRKEKGVVPTRAELFKITHVHKNGDPMNEECANKIREIDMKTKNQPDTAKKGAKEVNDLFSEIFGKEKHGRVRGLGLGPAPTHIWTDAPSPAACIRMATEARKKAEEETKEMKERMMVMETQLAEMKAMMTAMLQHKSTDFHQSNYTPNPMDGQQNIVDANNPKDALEREARSSSSSHEFQSYQVHQAKKKRVQHEPETKGAQEVLLMSIGQPHRPIARGLLFSKDPSTIVGGDRLGQQYWEVYIEVVMIPTESLIRSYHGMTKIRDAARKSIAWPSYLVKPVKR
uniref:Transposase Tnp1/En/Spm-like domain-containing protein n=1 Tax=Ananas comosus var. bracteatus TaxID=296719 RepID=A0A6V7NQ27_ANACO|nr:unnamed protein product [Ananas comosus var. bracteatus]